MYGIPGLPTDDLYQKAPGNKVIGTLIKFTVITVSNAAWAKQLDTTQIVVMCVGGGGNGGPGGTGATGVGQGGFGGSSGGRTMATIPATSTTYSAVVGGVTGSTSFGGLATAAGGINGNAGTSDLTAISWQTASCGSGDGSGQGGTANVVGGNATSYGGGGGGGGGSSSATQYAGGNGFAGVIYVWEYA